MTKKYQKMVSCIQTTNGIPVFFKTIIYGIDFPFFWKLLCYEIGLCSFWFIQNSKT